ncbi:unnamed protein product, partial [Phaeothamnion confervicola]
MNKVADMTRLVEQRRLRGEDVAFHRAMHAHPSFVDKLACINTLRGHTGCVNRIAWNEEGSLLATGSDDTRIGIFDYATGEARALFETGHSRNIFGVRILPATGSTAIVTGAMDCEVRLHTAPFDRPSHSRALDCHAGRVKAVETASGDPHLFWSAAEDGMVRQYDRRLPGCGCVHRTGAGTGGGGGGGVGGLLGLAGFGSTRPASYESPNVVVGLGKGRGGNPIRGMGLAISPTDSNMMAVACSDHLVRLYDRRRLTPARPRLGGSGGSSTGGGSSATPGTPVLAAFCPPHLRRQAPGEAHSTSVAFSPCGRELLASYHGDHAYLFSVAGGGGGGDGMAGSVTGNILSAFCLPPGVASLLASAPGAANAGDGKGRDAGAGGGKGSGEGDGGEEGGGGPSDVPSAFATPPRPFRGGGGASGGTSGVAHLFGGTGSLRRHDDDDVEHWAGR